MQVSTVLLNPTEVYASPLATVILLKLIFFLCYPRGKNTYYLSQGASWDPFLISLFHEFLLTCKAFDTDSVTFLKYCIKLEHHNIQQGIFRLSPYFTKEWVEFTLNILLENNTISNVQVQNLRKTPHKNEINTPQKYDFGYIVKYCFISFAISVICALGQKLCNRLFKILGGGSVICVITSL